MARSTTYKIVAFNQDDYKFITEVKDKWVKKNRVDISVAKMIKLAIEEYNIHKL